MTQQGNWSSSIIATGHVYLFPSSITMGISVIPNIGVTFSPIPTTFVLESCSILKEIPIVLSMVLNKPIFTKLISDPVSNIAHAGFPCTSIVIDIGFNSCEQVVFIGVDVVKRV